MTNLPKRFRTLVQEGESMDIGHLKVDWHLHANFRVSDRAAMSKARRYWRRFAQLGLDAVLLCEHQYLDPMRAYSIMTEERPKDSNTLLFAGTEIVCRANKQESHHEAHAELIVSTCDPTGTNLYGKPFLACLGQLTLAEAVQKVTNDDSLDCYIPHPYVLGKTGAVKCLGESELCRIIAENKKVGIEIHNGSFNLVYEIFKRKPSLAYVMARLKESLFQGARYWPTLESIEKTKKTPDRLLFDNNGQMRAGFFAGGSDAHFPENITSYLVIPMDMAPLGQSTDQRFFRSLVYKAIVGNKSRCVEFHLSNASLFWFFQQWATLIKEGLVKQAKKKKTLNLAKI